MDEEDMAGAERSRAERSGAVRWGKCTSTVNELDTKTHTRTKQCTYIYRQSIRRVKEECVEIVEKIKKSCIA